MHALDNVIWRALTTRQSHFAECFQSARRFVHEVTSLCAFEEPDAQGFADLGELVGIGSTAAVFLDDPYETQPGWEFIVGAPLLEMVCENGADHKVHSDSMPEFVRLGAKDAAEMVELATLTKPGPFGMRTHELGAYVGIRLQGRLVAMAGERLKVPGHTEVSAVCTHPDHIGKGYAGLLMQEIMRGIRERGETSFLHVREDNTRAVALYERLGFKTRIRLHFAVLRKT